ncbi:unnamed protein product [Coffea canephora]|uniref:Protein WUSCHEL n=1 Tax=Coffea canephora TaxID=49390 RepID=A0A068U2S0_COFCA|nr:unnamed protein product [Coffea canephora]
MEPQQQQNHQQQQQQNQLLPNEDGGCSKNGFLCRQSSTRWTPTTEQIRILKDLYYNNGVRSPTADQIQKISAKLRQYGKIEGKNVFYWFQNHKARERQKKRLTTDISAMQRGVWRSDYQESICSTKYPNITSGAPSSSASVGGLHAAGQVGNYGYGSFAMEKSFRDCSISPSGKASGSMFQNFSWAGAGAGAEPYPSPYQFLEKKTCFVETLDDQEQEEEPVPELETLPLFPMHGEDVSGFCTNKQPEQNCYYTDWYQPNGNVGYSRTSLELSLNTYGGRSQNSP